MVNQLTGGICMTVPESKEEKKQVYTTIIERIRDMIRTGDLRTGERLPPERRLAELLGVSRSHLRQAFQALAERKIIEKRQGDGTYLLVPLDASFAVDAIWDAISEQEGVLADILEFRQLMEPQIAVLAARRISPEGIDRLKILVCDQQRALLSGQEADSFDAEFHRLLVEYAGNQVIGRILATVQAMLNETRSPWLQSDERGCASVEGHLRIIDALEAGDATAAFTAMNNHLAEIEQHIFCDKESKRK